MPEKIFADLSISKIESRPFPHFSVESILQDGMDDKIYTWLDSTTDWHLTTMDFYDQFEFNMLDINLPAHLRLIIHNDTIHTITEGFKNVFGIKNLHLIGITAHKLIDGQRIAIHNDFINGSETHRLVLHFNPQWKEENGGYLMLFNSANAEDVSKVISPVNNTAFGFEISDRSYHAVSRVFHFVRYTIIYTFKKI